jgi:hypothetical protein
MAAQPHWPRLLALPAAALVLLVCSPAEANPMVFPGDVGREMVVFGLLCMLIVLVEGATIKLVLFGLDGPSWPKAFLLALVLNAISGYVGVRGGIYFDWWEFRFEPSVLPVLSVSLGIEGGALVVLFFRRIPRAVATAFLMNLASYAILVMSQFPRGALPGLGE